MLEHISYLKWFNQLAPHISIYDEHGSCDEEITVRRPPVIQSSVIGKVQLIRWGNPQGAWQDTSPMLLCWRVRLSTWCVYDEDIIDSEQRLRMICTRLRKPAGFRTRHMLWARASSHSNIEWLAMSETWFVHIWGTLQVFRTGPMYLIPMTYAWDYNSIGGLAIYAPRYNLCALDGPSRPLDRAPDLWLLYWREPSRLLTVQLAYATARGNCIGASDPSVGPPELVTRWSIDDTWFRNQGKMQKRENKISLS